jgi:hypothetical protein
LEAENPYLFQLILGVVQNLNSTILQCATVPIDDVRYGRIAKQILDIVATANITLGGMTPEQVTIEFAPIQEQLNALFAEEKLSWMELKYVMETVLTALKTVEQIFAVNIDRSLQRAEAKAIGVADMSDITMSKLHDYLLAE